MDRTTTISFRTHQAIRNELNKLSNNTDKSLSRICKEAISIYLDKHKDADIHESIQKIFDEKELFEDVYADDYYIQRQNERVSVRLKELTFIDYMEKNMAVIYMTNKPHMDNESLKSMIREGLESMKDRAEHHGFTDEWNNRYEEPIPYVEEYLDRKSVEAKAFNDFMDGL